MSKFISPTTVVDAEAFRPYGIQHRIVTEDGAEIHHTRFDAQPYIKRAEYLRQNQEKWDDAGTVWATLSMAQYLDLMSKGIKPSKYDKRFMAWLRENKVFCAFDKALL